MSKKFAYDYGKLANQLADASLAFKVNRTPETAKELLSAAEKARGMEIINYSKFLFIHQEVAPYLPRDL